MMTRARPDSDVPSRSPHAFTLVELLVVIGIIGVLVSILLPVINRARQHAQNISEMSSLREVLIAYTAYATDNKGTLLAGHASETTPTPQIPDDRGNAIPPFLESVKRWPWILLASAKYEIKYTLYIGERKNRLWGEQMRTMAMWHYIVSLTPSFGLNMYNLGGDLRSNGSNNEPNWARKITNVKNTSGMIVFASARGPVGAEGGEAGMISDEGGNVNGYWYVVSPQRKVVHPVSGAITVVPWSTSPYSEAGDADSWGNIHARLGGKVAVGYLDGHCDIRTPEELRDPVLWTNP